MKTLIIFIVVVLILTTGFIKFSAHAPSVYDVKYFLNRNFDTHYRLDIYPEFFGDTKSFESAQAFNNGEISYQQYAVQKGYSIKTVPIEWIDNPAHKFVGSGGMGGPKKIDKDSIALGGGAGGGAYMNEDCTMKWYSVDENGNMVGGPGGCF